MTIKLAIALRAGKAPVNLAESCSLILPPDFCPTLVIYAGSPDVLPTTRVPGALESPLFLDEGVQDSAEQGVKKFEF